MNLSKKKLEKIQITGAVHEVLRQYGHDFFESPPDLWDDSQRELYDMLCDHERMLIGTILKILKGEGNV